ncbi:SPASM domain-containing protein [Geobacter sp. DSM 9736]|uniref:SPASM domain-containing protein n=1 Tax=Geobacter sp. DSM 9736 TaxID=1277350 RepID=UPI000B5092D1|nr:SPASM domain-containing protein [Geobacter sp. DSM 9736]SNB47469.1 GeoRSP system SPASM domain protein [Geobacter sp. DSM 9736]
MFELKVPIRLYWDLPRAEEGMDPAAVCFDILRLKILSLNIDAGSALSSCKNLLQCLGDTGLSVTIALDILEAASRTEEIKTLKVKSVLVKVDSFEQLQVFRAWPHPLGIQYEVTMSNWRELPMVLAFCAGNGIRQLVLPMQRLLPDLSVSCFHLTHEEKIELAASLGQISSPTLNITIHDPFLWKIFFPSRPFPDGGCQAANTMLYIAPGGEVFPCPTLPISLGNLRNSSLYDIVFSEAKIHTRGRIMSSPGGCIGCGELSSCKGGCRGRALVLTESLDGADPGCDCLPVFS